MSATPALPVLDAVAWVLTDLGEELERLGAVLCADPELADRHLMRLQAIDRVAQFQRSLAALLRAGCTPVAIEASGLAELRERLSEVSTDRQQESAGVLGEE